MNEEKDFDNESHIENKNINVNIITRTSEGGINCGDHVNCFV